MEEKLTMVKIDENLHAQVKKIVADQKVDYPTIQFYVNRAIKNQLRIDMLSIREGEAVEAEPKSEE